MPNATFTAFCNRLAALYAAQNALRLAYPFYVAIHTRCTFDSLESDTREKWRAIDAIVWC
jgi:hypothetical protein